MNDSMHKTIVAGAIAIALAGCAGRSAQPVATVQPLDAITDCDAIRAEMAANSAKMGDLDGERSGKVAQNVAAGVVGLFIWPMWFAMDLQGSAATEEDALRQRQQYLTTLASKRCA